MDIKEEMIDAVVELFNEKGLKFTMDDLARYMGISKRTIYSIVEDKEALFVEAVDSVFGAIKKSEQEILVNSSMDTLSKLKKLLIILPERYKTVDFRQLYDLKVKYPKIYAKIEHRIETDWEPTYQLMEQAMDEGKIRRINLSVFHAIFSGTIEYYLSRPIWIDKELTYDEALKQMLDILIDGIKV